MNAWAGEPEVPAHQIVHLLGERFGYWALLGLIGLGALWVFREKLKKWLKP